MQLACSRCGHLLEFSHQPPRFCSNCGQPLSAAATDPAETTPHPGPPAAAAAVPEIVGGYRLLRVLGGGGMGTVYEAEEAAPHVTGIAALLAERQRGDLVLGTANGTTHLGYKAIILNSARKRHIDGVNSLYHEAKDHDTSKNQASDVDYLKFDSGVYKLNDAEMPGKTEDWTPANWSLQAIPDVTDYKRLVTTSPLDDEQGTGVADAQRALVQYNGGVGLNVSGKQAPGNVTGIGWNIGQRKKGEEDVYTLNLPIAQGSMITATLVWDRVLEEANPGVHYIGKYDRTDSYKPPAGAPKKTGGLPDFTLEIKYEDKVVARSVSTVDNVEHLHLPAPVFGVACKYKIVVKLNEHVLGANANHSYAVAWSATEAQ